MNELIKTEGIRLPKATHQGHLKLGNLDLDCYVLEDGRRVFHKRGMAKALGMRSEGGNVFLRTMQSKGISSELSRNLLSKIEHPINFKPINVDVGHGYESHVLVDICKVVVKADENGKLMPSQSGMVDQAKKIMNALSKVGINALIDEATGYQTKRPDDALRVMISQYVEAEKHEWEKLFPHEYYNNLNRIYGSDQLTITGAGTVIQNRPQHFAKFTRRYIYEPLENGAVLEELDRINPKIDKRGTRRARLHQHLSEGYGMEKLRRQIGEVLTLMKVSNDIKDFKHFYDRRFGGNGVSANLVDNLSEIE